MKWLALAFVAMVACSKKQPPGPTPRCVVKVDLSTDITKLKAKAPQCSVTITAPEATSYRDVIALMDSLAHEGFTDFGLGDVVNKLPVPTRAELAVRMTSEGSIVGRFEGVTNTPMIMLMAAQNVGVGGVTVGSASDPNLTDEIIRALPKGTPMNPTIIISGHASLTYGPVYRAAVAADRAGYTNILFALQR